MTGSPIYEAEPRQVPERAGALLDEQVSRIRSYTGELGDWFQTYARQHRDRLARDLILVERFVAPGSTLLEYGAIPLLLTGALAASGYAVQGVDLEPGRFGTAELGFDVTACDVERECLPWGDASFDAVLFNELFEHLRIDPIHTLREAYRVLRPDGRLLLSTPNLRSFRGMRSLLLQHRGHTVRGGVWEQWSKLETLGHMGHVREYTAREVAEFLGHLGFRVERVIHRGGYGRGLVGIAERLAPGFRPFFTVVASRPSS